MSPPHTICSFSCWAAYLCRYWTWPLQVLQTYACAHAALQLLYSCLSFSILHQAKISCCKQGKWIFKKRHYSCGTSKYSNKRELNQCLLNFVYISRFMLLIMNLFVCWAFFLLLLFWWVITGYSSGLMIRFAALLQIFVRGGTELPEVTFSLFLSSFVCLLLSCSLLLDLQKMFLYAWGTLFSPAWGQEDCFPTLNIFLIHLFGDECSSQSSYAPVLSELLMNCTEIYHFVCFSWEDWILGWFILQSVLLKCIVCQQYSCYQNVLLCFYYSVLWRTIKWFILYHSIQFSYNNVQRWNKNKLTYKGNKVDVNWGKNGGVKALG